MSSIAQKEAEIRRQLDKYRESDYTIIAIIGFGGSGKSTFGNLYCGWTDHAPFRVEHLVTKEGTLETTGFADESRRIFWLDTRGLSTVFDFRQWMIVLESLGAINGVVLIGYPLARTFGNDLETFSSQVSAENFNCLRLYRADLHDFVKESETPHMYEQFRPFSKKSREPFVEEFIARTVERNERFRIFDVPRLTQRVIELQGSLQASQQDNDTLHAQLAEANATIIQVRDELLQSQTSLAEANATIIQVRDELLQSQTSLAEANVTINQVRGELLQSQTSLANAQRYKLFMRNEFNLLVGALQQFFSKSLQSRSQVFRRHAGDEHQYQRRGFNHLFSLGCMLTGQLLGALLNEDEMYYSREIRESMFVLKGKVDYLVKEIAAGPRAVLPAGSASAGNTNGSEGPSEDCGPAPSEGTAEAPSTGNALSVYDAFNDTVGNYMSITAAVAATGATQERTSDESRTSDSENVDVQLSSSVVVLEGQPAMSDSPAPTAVAAPADVSTSAVNGAEAVEFSSTPALVASRTSPEAHISSVSEAAAPTS
jgi:hypothetical protein